MSRLAGSRSGRWASATWGAFAIGCGGAFATSSSPSTVVIWAIAVVGGILIAAAVSTTHVGGVAIVGVALVLGVLRGATAVNLPGAGSIDGNFGARPLVVLGTVRSADPGSGSSAIVDATRLSDADTDRAITGGVLVSGPLIPALAPGDAVEIDAAGLRPLDRRPGPDSEATLERDGVEGIATAPQVFVLAAGGASLPRGVSWVQGRLIAAVDRSLPEPAAALVVGVAFGIHEPLSTDVRTPLQDAGLIHIVVVSGLKVVLVLGLVGALGRVFEWSRRRTLLTAAPLVAGYVLVSGAGPAAIRSALMAGAALLATTGARRTDPVPMLALSAALMLGLAPNLVGDPGFQLSFVGTAGILLLASPIATRLPGPRILVEPFAVTVAAQLATLPVMAGTFGVVALVGPIANAIVLPLLPAMIVAGGSGAILSAIHPAFGWLPLQLAGLGTGAITAVARLVTALPGAAIQVGSWPASWSIAELAGLLTAALVVAVAARRARAAVG